ncbi:hypothetical protein B0H11DRAFT_2082381 [Mycena galericulata]|nr:hypothetical protein B0H11DRAFT_2082381 [Mycena galericulata]
MDVEQDTEPTQLVRSSEVWFDDGTVVLQAEKTLFRVYRGVLAAQSPIFRDTFAIPQPPAQDSETYEGCPLVLLHDSAHDLKLFLMAIHDAGYLINSPVDGMKTLSGLLKLATKYDVEHIRTRMISILTTIYPSSLTEWRSRKPPAGYEELDFDDFLAANLALELHILSVLPGILYECCRYPTSHLFPSELGTAEKQKCIIAKERYMNDWSNDVHDFLFVAPDTCENRIDCDSVRLRWLRINGIPTFTDVFAGPFPWGSIELCERCLARGKEQYRIATEKLWDDLPSLFGLPPWEELLKSQ